MFDLRRELKVVSDVFVRGSCSSNGCGAWSGNVVGLLLLLLLEYSQESFSCTQPNGGSLSSSPGWFLLHPLSPQDPAAAMQSAQPPWEAGCAGAAAWDAGDQPGPGSFRRLHRRLIAFCACPLWHKTSSFPSLFRPVLWLNLVVEGMLERAPAVSPLGCSSHDLGCLFLGLGWPEFAVPRKS